MAKSAVAAFLKSMVEEQRERKQRLADLGVTGVTTALKAKADAGAARQGAFFKGVESQRTQENQLERISAQGDETRKTALFKKNHGISTSGTNPDKQKVPKELIELDFALERQERSNASSQAGGGPPQSGLDLSEYPSARNTFGGDVNAGDTVVGLDRVRRLLGSYSKEQLAITAERLPSLAKRFPDVFGAQGDVQNPTSDDGLQSSQELLARVKERFKKAGKTPPPDEEILRKLGKSGKLKGTQ